MTVELVKYQDCVQPFLIHHSNIRGRVVRLADVADTILTRHEYPEVVSRLLAELLVIATMLSANLKGKGILTLQLKGDGPVKFVVVDSTAEGALRGYAQLTPEGEEKLAKMKPENAKLPDIMGKGYIAITLDQGKEPYQGIVELNGDTLSETLQGYFTHSEQSEMMVKVEVGKNVEEAGHPRWRVGGIMLQHVPQEGGINAAQEDDPQENWRRACMLAATAKDKELLDHYLPPQQLLYRLFNEDGVWIYGVTEVTEHCRCSREKISRTLASFPTEEMAEMVVEGVISVVCQFCNTEERFTLAEISAT